MSEININADLATKSSSSNQNCSDTKNPIESTQEELIFDNSNPQVDENIESLKEEFETAQDEQGFLGKLWDGFKNLTGLGHSSNDVEDKIEQYENGEITYEEALNSIDSFKQKQDGMVNIIANTVTGLATAGLTIATGGVGALAAGALIGGLTKAGLKTLDRATNNVEGDAIDVKEIIKDGATGAVDGLVSAATAGLVKGPIAGQTVKEAVKQGAIQGAKAGAISGAVTGATDYTVEAAVEEDKEFTFEGLLTTTAQNALSGTIFGGLFGGITSGVGQSRLNGQTSHDGANILTQQVDDIPDTTVTATEIDEVSNVAATTPQQVDNLADVPTVVSQVDNNYQALDYIENYNLKNPEKAISEPQQIAETTAVLEELSRKSEDLAVKFGGQVDEATQQVNSVFSGNDDIEILTSRAKGQKSIFSKLAKKKLSGSSLEDMNSCYDAIGDAVGIKIQMKGLDSSEAKTIVEDVFQKNGINLSFDDFSRYIQDENAFSGETKEILSGVRGEIIDALKTSQTQSVVDQLADAVSEGKITITELNNYGSDITSYFTDKQIAQITDAYAAGVKNGKIVNDKPFEIVSQNRALELAQGDCDITDTIVSKYTPKDPATGAEITVKQNTGKAIKESGYSTSQMNTKHEITGGVVANGELQIRGTKLNAFADVEHIPYDIRTGKISINDPKYSDVYKIIDGMSDANYNNYNEYLTDVYKTLRLQELGLLPENASMPSIKNYIKNGEIADEFLSMLDMDGLINISKRGH